MIDYFKHKRSNIEAYFPFLTWFSNYGIRPLQDDALAGVTVAVVLIPQSMAYAMIAGLPPVYGLYSATVCPLIAAFWGSLKQLSTGPVAITSLLVLTSLSPVASPGSESFISLAFTLSFLVGLFYLVLGFLRLGQLMNFISHSSVKGFTAAAAIIIITTQLPNLLGIRIQQNNSALSSVSELLSNSTDLNPYSLGIGLCTFAIIILLKRLNPRLPAGLLALSIAAICAYVFSLESHGVGIVGSIEGGLPPFSLPTFTLQSLNRLAGPAIVIALVSFAETYSIGKAIASQSGQKVSVDQELVGQGLANLVGSFFHCYPSSGSFSRTALNFTSGAKTGMASVFSSVIVIITLLFLTPLLTYIPKAALAALVITAVATLFRPKELMSLYNKSRHDGIVAVTVFVMGLLIKPDYALLLGILLSLFFYLWKTMHPKIISITKDESLNSFINADVEGKPVCHQLLLLQVNSEIYFGNADFTMEQIRHRVTAHGKSLKHLILDFQGVTCIDITGIDELQKMIEDVQLMAIQTTFINLNDEVQKIFKTSGLLDHLNGKNIFTSKGPAIASLFLEIDHNYCRETCPLTIFEECSTVKQLSSTTLKNDLNHEPTVR